MPLDLSEIAADADLGQPFQVIRTTGNFVMGRGYVPNVTEVVISTFGVEVPASAKALQMIPEGDRAAGTLQIITVTPLYTTDGKRNGVSDRVKWQGDMYSVENVEPWGDSGFVSAVLARMTGN